MTHPCPSAAKLHFAYPSQVVGCSVIAPSGLVSLFDMLRIHAQEFVELGKTLHDFRSVLYVVPEDDGSTVVPTLSQEMLDDQRLFLLKTAKRCSELDLRSAGLAFAGAAVDPPRSDREFAYLDRALNADLKAQLFLFVPPHRAAQYEREDMMSEPAKVAFPTALQELRSAGNCFAANLPTACVFHCMRALEHGLRAVAADVGKTFDIQMWQNIIDEIEGEIAKLGKTLPRGQAKGERLQFLGEAAKEFTYFKDGWRNYVSHGKAAYGEQQALTVMSHTRDFLERLADGHLHE